LVDNVFKVIVEERPEVEVTMTRVLRFARGGSGFLLLLGLPCWLVAGQLRTSPSFILQ
jgi:hypothetical protein